MTILNKSLVLFITICVIVVSSCKRDDCSTPNEEYYPMTQKIFDSFPYNGTEILTFQITYLSGATSDTIALKGTGFFHDEKIQTNVRVGELCQTNIYGEGFRIEYTSNDAKKTLKLCAINESGSEKISYRVNNSEWITGILHDFLSNKHSCYIGDSIFTNHKYNDVTVIEYGPCSVSSPGEYPNEVYFFDKEYGIVRIETEVEVWDLIPN